MLVYDTQPKVALDEFIDDLRYDVPGVPQAAWKNYIRRAATHMANAGNILRRKATITAECDVHNYRLEPPDCMDVVAILSVRNTCGSSCTGEIMRLTQEPGGGPCGCGTVSWFEEPNEIWFNQVQPGDVFEVIFSVAPTYDACELDGILRKGDYYETLLIGARALAYDVADQYWYDPNKSLLLQSRFEQRIRNLSLTSYLGKQRGMMRPRRRRFL